MSGLRVSQGRGSSRGRLGTTPGNDARQRRQALRDRVLRLETGGRKFLKLQILSAAQVIEGKRPQVPFGHTESLKKAARESEDRQGRFL